MIIPKAIPTREKVANFEDALAAFERAAREHEQHRIVFRGHADSTWKYCPSLFRQEPDISMFEHQMIREMISAFPSHFSDDLSMFDKLVRMQHFGLPTRLLDVTRNPLVALYFACDPDEDDAVDGAVVIVAGDDGRHKFFDSDVVSCMANLANLTNDEKQSIADTPLKTIKEIATLNAINRLGQFIRGEKPYFVDRIRKIDLFRPVLVTPKMSNVRLNAQFGEFVLYGLESETGPSYKKTNFVTQIVVERDAKTIIRSKLENLGISGATMFPEIDKAAKQIKNKYKVKSKLQKP